MANTNSVTPWVLTMPAGSLEQYSFTFTVPGTGAPFPIGNSWEYVVRETPASPAVIDITTTAGAEGAITVTSTATLSQVVLTLNPVATVNLTPGEYNHTLWAEPGTVTQFTWVTGSLLIVGNPQP